MEKEGILAIALALALIQISFASANTAPIIEKIDDELIVCEASTLEYYFDVIDIDETSIDVGISPSGPFFIKKDSSSGNKTKVLIYSGALTKVQANKIYEEEIFVSDGQYSDSRNLKITVLESNNPPVIGHLGVQTILADTVGSTFKRISVKDLESGDQNTGNFIFNVTDKTRRLDLEISDFGLLNISLTDSTGSHEVEICVLDSGVKDTSGKIGFCDQGDLRKSSCKNFKVWVVENNTAPTIVFHNSSNITDRISGRDTTKFDIFKFDPDGTIPDTYWYVDEELKRIDSGNSTDKFVYSFGCGTLGRHTIRAEITDGLLTDSIKWKFDLVKIDCIDGEAPGESFNVETCKESWGCHDWNLCQNAAQSQEIGLLSNKDYQKIKDKCTSESLSKGKCGFNTRNCIDISGCKTLRGKPAEIDFCEFSLNPSCLDGIKNCHEAQCELEIDCGGPCSACNSCSDGIKNQGEENIDCGSPCLNQCAVKTISDEEKDTTKKFMIAILIAIAISVVQIIRIVKARKKAASIFNKGGINEFQK